MNAPHRTSHAPMVAAPPSLVDTGWAGRLLAHAPARLFHRLIDRLDTLFDAGSIEGALPDGTVRVVGGRGAGPHGRLTITSWAALARLALSGSNGWFHAWMAGEWHSEDPVTVIAAFSANRRTLAN
ncbi:MAG: SAM-dependent methyltransferase, partial [Sphingopyxis sp.]